MIRAKPKGIRKYVRVIARRDQPAGGCFQMACQMGRSRIAEPLVMGSAIEHAARAVLLAGSGIFRARPY